MRRPKCRSPARRWRFDLRAAIDPHAVSFDVGMRQLAVNRIMLTGAEMQLGRGETIADTARVLSRYVDAIMIRILNHRALLELAAMPPCRHNGLTRRSHPLPGDGGSHDLRGKSRLHRGPHGGWTATNNNVLASWAHAAERFKFKLNVATPPQLAPNKAMKDWIRATQGADRARQRSGSRGSGCRLRRHRHLGVDGRQGRRARHNLLSLPGQRQADVAGQARRAVHALPAGASRRGGHDEVIDGPQSVVFDEPKIACTRKRHSGLVLDAGGVGQQRILRCRPGNAGTQHRRQLLRRASAGSQKTQITRYGSRRSPGRRQNVRPSIHNRRPR